MSEAQLRNLFARQNGWQVRELKEVWYVVSNSLALLPPPDDPYPDLRYHAPLMIVAIEAAGGNDHLSRRRARARG